jgi:hypothetical protein
VSFRIEAKEPAFLHPSTPMKTFLAAASLLLLALIWFHRERVFLRDPLATVYLDGAPQTGIQVFINHSNDVLIEKDDPPNPYRILIQRWNQSPGTPTILRCVRWMACLTESDQPPTIPLALQAIDTPPIHSRSRPTPRTYNPQVTMTNRETTFTTPEGTHLRITLR